MGTDDPVATTGDRVTQRDILHAVNGLEERLGERIDGLAREQRQFRETHEQRHLADSRQAIEDHAAIRQLQGDHKERSADLKALQTVVGGHATLWAELKGMGVMLKLVFGSSVLGAVSGFLALAVVFLQRQAQP